MKYPAQLSEVFDFGRYHGNTVEEIIDRNAGYVEWLCENKEGFALAVGAKRYLEEMLLDCHDFEVSYREIVGE